MQPDARVEMGCTRCEVLTALTHVARIRISTIGKLSTALRHYRRDYRYKVDDPGLLSLYCLLVPALLALLTDQNTVVVSKTYRLAL